jgi:hypothetical protein
MNLTINLDEGELKVLEKRAKSNFLSVKEQVEDIVRRSCLSYKKKRGYKSVKVDDKLVGIFSREKRGRKKR